MSMYCVSNNLKFHKSPLKLFQKDEMWPENFIVSLIILKDESYRSINITIDNKIYGNLSNK